MAEIQIKTILDTSSFDAGVKTVQAKITELESKTVNIRFNKTSSSNFTNNLKKEMADSTTAMQRQINALTGVDREFKSAAESANYFKLSGKTAYEQVGAQAEALARTQAEMASSGTTAMQRQINALTGVDREFKSAADSADYFKKTGLTAFEEQSKAVDEFNKKLARIGQVIKTAAAAMLVKGLKDAVTEMKAVDAELINTAKATGASSEKMKELEQGAYRLAEAYGHTASEVLEAETAFARAGYGDKIEQMAELNLLTQNAGDLSSEEASSFLLAADAAFGYEGNVQKLTAVLDGMNEVSNKNATDMSKMAEGMTVAGSVFASAGESAQTFTAMLGTATAATQRSGSEMARGLRTIFMNIRQIKGETEDGELIDGESIANAAKALREFAGIDTMANGELRKGSEILAELAGKWDTLSDVQKSAIAQNVAGVRQANILLALMDNWGTYEKMMAEYANAAGSAMQENERYLEGWQAKTDKLSAAWTKFVANTISSDFIKGLLDISTKFLNVSGSIGTVTVAMTGLVLAFKGAKIVDTVKTAFAGLGAVLKDTTVSLTSLTSIAGMAITAMAVLAQFHANWRAERASDSAEAVKQTEETISKQEQLNDLIAQYRELAGDSGIGTDTAKQEQARAIQEQIVGLVGDQATGIDLVNGALETQLGILNNIAGKYADMALDDLQAAANTAAQALSKSMNDTFTSIGRMGFGDQKLSDYVKGLQYIKEVNSGNGTMFKFFDANSLEEQVQAVKELKELRNYMQDNGMESYGLYASVNEQLAEYTTLVNNATEAREAYLQQQIKIKALEKGGLTDKNIDDAAWEVRLAENASVWEAERIDNAAAALKGYTTENQKAASGAGETSDALETETESAKSLQEETVKYQKQLDVLKKAQQEENETGMITADTFEEIKDAGVEVGDYYVDELTGNIKMADGAIQDLIDTNQEWLDTYGNTDPMGVWEKGLERAQNALARFKKELQETGERGDTLSEMQSSYSSALELYNEGKYGSREYQGVLDLFLSDDKKNEFGNDAQKWGEFLFNEFNKGLLESADTVDAMDYLEKNFEKNFGNMEQAGASFVKNTDGSISMFIDDMDRLVEVTGISENFWSAFKDSLDQYNTDIIQKENQKAVESVQDLSTATEETETDKTVEIDASEAVTATEQVNGLGDAIAAIPRNVNIRFSISNGSNSFYGKNNLNLTKFSANAEGTDNSPGGMALVNELGPELISENGRAYIANGGEPAIVRLQPGAVVLNHIQTQKALGNTDGFGEINAYKKGTSMWQQLIPGLVGTVPGKNSSKNTNKSSGSKASKNTAADASTKEDDPWKIVEDYYNYSKDLADRAKDHLDYLVDKIQNEWDDLKEPLDDQIDALERVNDQLDRQATLLERERDKLTKPLQDQIDAMNDAKDIQDEQLELAEKQKAVEEARAELQNAQNERTIRYFNTEKGQWEWMADKKRVQDAQDAITSAEKDLADYEYELKIKALERQVSSIEDDYQKKLDAIEEQQTANEDRIYDLEQQLQDMEDYYKAQMKPLEKQIETMERQMADYAELWAQIAITQDLPEGDLNAAINRLGNLTPEQKQSIRDIIEGVKNIPNGSGTESASSSAGEVASSIQPGKGTWESALSQIGATVDGKNMHVYGDGATVYNTITNNDSHNVSYTINGVTVQGDPSKMTISDLLESTGIYAGE
mgnify:CR=1 FL=1|nr:MAG TPA: minor tail protein [Caudoviricetes sp.]